jgi:peptide/nickel transport system permease protein
VAGGESVKYVLVRIAQTVPVLVIVAVIAFTIMHMTPGDPAAVILGENATAQQVSDLRQQMGLDKPLYVQFFVWFGNLLRGNLGYSAILQQSVNQALMEHLQPTLFLSLGAELIACIIAIPAGVFAARKRGTWLDMAFMSVTLLGISTPSFFMALLLVLLFTVKLGLLPVGGYVSPFDDFGQFLSSMAMPMLALAIIQASLIARMTRSSVLDTLGLNYIETAKSKGISEFELMVRHALRNSAMPIITVVGQSVGTLLTGAIIIETVFNIPGIGQLVSNSILRRDYEVIQGIVLVSALIYVVINFLVDLSYGLLDPRVRRK